ncbi:hypothetical protein [Bacillus paranthracis]|uniref:hypothetical protein n=2 Tax=Bacillus paranthracis TaxID=2026186 RepID=UPI00224F042E|nr:hypothetical protein [Bacillus paranthracis]
MMKIYIQLRCVSVVAFVFLIEPGKVAGLIGDIKIFFVKYPKVSFSICAINGRVVELFHRSPGTYKKLKIHNKRGFFMMDENKALHFLINATNRIGVIGELAIRQDIMHELVDSGYLVDMDVPRFTEQAKELLTRFYEENKDKVMDALRSLEVLAYVSYEDICKAADMNDTTFHLEYLMKRLESNGKIIIKNGTNWDGKIKFSINKDNEIEDDE